MVLNFPFIKTFVSALLSFLACWDSTEQLWKQDGSCSLRGVCGSKQRKNELSLWQHENALF